MPTLVVSSPKGGVGKTSLTANIAVALVRRQMRVTAVDFDPQNALRHHFGLDGLSGPGVSALLESGGDWSSACVDTPSGVRLLPHGDATLEQVLRSEARVSTDELRFQFRQLAPGPRDVVIADTPPGQSRFMAALEPIADVSLVVFLADAGSMSLVPAYDEGKLLRPLRPGDPKVFGILNQVDPRRRLSREISEFVREQLSDRFIGMVHYDEALAEALAKGTTLMAIGHATAGAAQDIVQITEQLAGMLA